jgi:2-dehydro-3-deoxygalactonokinase
MDGNAMTSKAELCGEVKHPALIALDWGTTSLRVFLLDDRGAIAMQREAPWGIQQLPGASLVEGFNQAFESMVGDWLARWPGLPVIASGMVGSAHGWREAPYLTCPVYIASFHQHLTAVTSLSGTRIHIAPGLVLPSQVTRGGGTVVADVMRGEEIQVLGALSIRPEWQDECCIVLPGTHSKWVWVKAGQVAQFMTSMAGELFAVLRQHSILGRLMPVSMPDSTQWEAFEKGVSLAYAAAPGMLISLMFSARSRVLTGELASYESPDYLSGLLIGSELAAALKQHHGKPVTTLGLVGSPELCSRYERALALVGHRPSAVLGNTAPQGLWKVAVAAGLAAPLGAVHVA